LFDPAWLAAQQESLGRQAGALAGVIDVKTLLDNMVDPSLGKDFCFLGVDIDGGSNAAKFGWIALNLGLSPFESTTRLTYFFIGGAMLGNYVQNYSTDYQQMKALATDAIHVLEGLQAGLRPWVAQLDDARQAMADRAADVAQFGEAHPDWVSGHRAEFDAKAARDAATLQHIDQMLQSLAGLDELLANLVPWVRSLVYAPDGSDLPAYLLAYPTSLLRLTSAMLMLGDAMSRVMLVAPPPPSTDATVRGPEVLEKRFPDSYLDSEPLPPDDADESDDFFKRLNERDPVDEDE
jgi:hypothetical protein